MNKTYHSNKKVKWDFSGNAYHKNGRKAYDSLTGTASHENGRKAYESLTNTFYDENGRRSNSAKFNMKLGISITLAPKLKINVYGRKINK